MNYQQVFLSPTVIELEKVVSEWLRINFDIEILQVSQKVIYNNNGSSAQSLFLKYKNKSKSSPDKKLKSNKKAERLI
jgi:hypothetical protein